MDQAALADFLRSRRSGLRPEDVGLAAGPRRLVQGLRREEVAALAGMSADYYVRMEQARSPQPSGQMLAALARALRLSNDERDYLYRLAGHNVPARWFTDPAEREIYPVADRPRQSRAQLAGLRAAFGAAGQRSRAGALVRELSRVSVEFAEIWELQDVATRFEDHKTLIHPELGAIELDCQTLFTEDQGQALLILTAAPRSEAAEKLALLAVLGHQRFAPTAVTDRPAAQ